MVGYGLSEEFKVNIGLRQGNDPLLFIMVVALISRKFSKKDVLRKGMYANDLAMIADKKQELQEVLEEWKGVFKKEGPIMSREKTEEMWVLHQREDLNISLDDKEFNQVDGFVKVGGMVNEDEHSEVEMRCRIQQGANAWGKVEGVMLDRNILKKLKRKVLRACVTQACLNLYLVTVALTEQQQQLKVGSGFVE